MDNWYTDKQQFNEDQLGLISLDFLQRTDIDPNTNCWYWRGAMSGDGYGRITLKGKKLLAVHRVSAAVFLGFNLDSPLFVCHKCDKKNCINPDHLFVGTNSDNQKDAVNKGVHGFTKSTHCPQGHEYTAENTIIEQYNNKTSRRCRTCRDNRNRETWLSSEYKEKRRLEARESRAQKKNGFFE